MSREREDITVSLGSTEQSEISDIFLTYRNHTLGAASFVVGYPGLPNDEHNFRVGDALLHQSPDKGIFEVRALVVASNLVRFRITEISPRLGLVGGLTSESDVNNPFSEDELAKIGQSLEEATQQITAAGLLSTDQLRLVAKTIDDLKESSQRLGRKDWILVVAGAVAGSIADLGLDVAQAKGILRALSSSLSWVFENARLLGHVVGQ